jgi:hypothetical protein
MDLPSRRLLQDSQAFIDSIKKLDVEQPKEEEEVSEALEQSGPILPPVGFNKGPKLRFWPSLQQDFNAELVTFIEVFFNKYNTLPNKADFERQFSYKADLLPQSQQAWEDKLLDLQEPLINRGIRPYETPPQYLEANFVLAVNLIVNVYDKRTIPAKLKDANLTSRQWTSFLRDEEHYKYYKEQLDKIFDNDLQLDAKVALHKLVQAGDLQAIKHYHELQNIYRPQQDNQKVVLDTLKVIMEILSLHVTPDVLGRVAAELRKANVIEAKAS